MIENCSNLWLVRPRDCSRILINADIQAEPELNGLGYFTMRLRVDDIPPGYLEECNLVCVTYQRKDKGVPLKQLFVGMLGGQAIDPVPGFETWHGRSLNAILKHKFLAFPTTSALIRGAGPADEVIHSFVDTAIGVGEVTEPEDPTLGQIEIPVSLERCECPEVFDQVFEDRVRVALNGVFPPEWNFNGSTLTLPAGTPAGEVTLCFDNILDCFTLTIGDQTIKLEDRTDPVITADPTDFQIIPTEDTVAYGDVMEFCIYPPDLVTADTVFEIDIGGDGSNGILTDTVLATVTATIPNLNYIPSPGLGTSAQLVFEAGYNSGVFCFQVDTTNTGPVTITLDDQEPSTENSVAEITVVEELPLIVSASVDNPFPAAGDDLLFEWTFNRPLTEDLVCKLCATGCIGKVLLAAVDEAGLNRNGLELIILAGEEGFTLPLTLPEDCNGETVLDLCEVPLTVNVNYDECADQVSLTQISPHCVRLQICAVPEVEIVRTCASNLDIISNFVMDRTDGQIPDTWEGNRHAVDLLEILQDISNAFDVDFEVTLNDDCTFCLETYHPSIGRDLTGKVILSEKMYNLIVEDHLEEWQDEIHEVIVFGPSGIGCYRSPRFDEIPHWCVNQRVITVSDQDTQEGLDTIAREEFFANQRLVQIDFELLETDQFIFCKDLQMGDHFTITYRGYVFEYRLVATPFRLRGNKFEWLPFVYKLTRRLT